MRTTFLPATGTLICPLWVLTTSSFLHAAEWQVRLPDTNTSTPSGRLLLLLEPFMGEQKSTLTTNSVYPGDISVASQQVKAFPAGGKISLDAASQVYKADFAMLPAGDYLAQVYLDRDYLYNLDQGAAPDMYSSVTKVTLPLETDALFTLDHEFPAYELWDFPNSREEDRARREAIRPRLQEFEITSRLLTEFWNRETKMRAWVLVPRDYDAQSSRSWPVAYLSGTFSATHKGNLDLASILNLFDVTNDPSMIWVFLDFWTPQGPSLFADSTHNGPWGTALVTELIPALEQQYRMDARPSGRLLTGHSSGGWASVWLLTHFPETFGGAWATAPDPLDFTTFLTTDLYADKANMYVDESGRAKGVVRNRDGIVTTVADAVRLENVLAPQGGIFQSWDWVFSPVDTSGNPSLLFDRVTGDVNPAVAAYWRENYDLSVYIRQNWSRLAPVMNGKLHVIVGTDDDHYLEDSVYKLRDTMTALGADASFEFMEGKTHNNLLSEGNEPLALLKRIASEMYETARVP